MRGPIKCFLPLTWSFPYYFTERQNAPGRAVPSSARRWLAGGTGGASRPTNPARAALPWRAQGQRPHRGGGQSHPEEPLGGPAPSLGDRPCQGRRRSWGGRPRCLSCRVLCLTLLVLDLSGLVLFTAVKLIPPIKFLQATYKF